MIKQKNLHYFTNKYPYNDGEQFITNELFSLSKCYDRIIIYPVSAKSTDKKTKEIPSNCIINTYNEAPITSQELQNIIKKMPFNFFKILFSEILSEKNKIFSKLKNIKTLFQKLAYNLVLAERLKPQLKNYKNDTFYCFWMNQSAVALAILKNKNYINSLFVRQHGYDLYNEIHPEGFIPFRIYVYKATKKLISISKTNIDYIKNNYPLFYKKVTLNFLGTKNYNMQLAQKKESNFIILSCSRLTPLKRVELIIDILSNVYHEIIWYHAGDGPEKEKIQQKAKKLPENIQYIFLGELSQDELFKFYNENNINLFIHTSSSEGLPISLIEAQSFGIPILSTNVGGVKEIVNEETGFLIEKEFNIEEVACLIDEIINSKKLQSKVERERIINYWKENFQHEKNIRELVNILENE